MKRIVLPVVVTLAAALAACGSDGSAAGSAGTSPVPVAATTVKVAMVDGVGNVLVDSAGRVLYSPDEEASGTVTCTGECVEYWRPLTAGATTPTGVSGLATIARPDNGKQVTVAGHPLYTFTTDAPGQAGGNGATDSFDGHDFHWHAVMADGSLAAAPAGSTPTTAAGGYNYGGGYGSGYGG